MLTVLVAVLYLSPAYAHSPPDHNGHQKLVDGGSGEHFVSVKAGTPVTVLGLYRAPAASGCNPPNAFPCKPHTYAVTQLPDGKVVLLHHKAVDYQTQTVRVDSNAAGPLTPGEVNDFLGLPGTGGAELWPLLGAVMLIGGALVLRRLLAMR
jgi:hypothetical protein